MSTSMYEPVRRSSADGVDPIRSECIGAGTKPKPYIRIIAPWLVANVLLFIIVLLQFVQMSSTARYIESSRGSFSAGFRTDFRACSALYASHD